jgi:hypothetical protein
MTTKNANTNTKATSTPKRRVASNAPSVTTALLAHAAQATTPTVATPSTTPTATPQDLGSVVSAFMTHMDQVEPTLGPEPTVTTSTQKRRTAKPRKGADKVLPMIASIVQQHGLDSSALSSKTVMDSYTTAQTLQPLQTRLQKMSKRVGDTAFAAQTDAWSMGLQLYSMLKRRAKTDGQVAEQIAPLAHVFAYRHPLVKAEKPTKRETQVKAQVKHVTALAEKHGVPIGENAGTSGATGAGSSPGAGGAAAQGQSAPLVSPVSTVSPPTTVSTQASPVAPAPVAAAPVPVPAPSAAPVPATGGTAPVVNGANGAGH